MLTMLQNSFHMAKNIPLEEKTYLLFVARADRYKVILRYGIFSVVLLRLIFILF